MIVTFVLVDETGEEFAVAGDLDPSAPTEGPKEGYGMGLSAGGVRRIENRALLSPTAGPAVVGEDTAYTGCVLRVYVTLDTGMEWYFDFPSPREDIFEADTRTLDMTNSTVITQLGLIQDYWRGPAGELIATFLGGERLFDPWVENE